jgi:hypothetical protein
VRGETRGLRVCAASRSGALAVGGYCCNIREISDMLSTYLNRLNILIPNKTSI